MITVTKLSEKKQTPIYCICLGRNENILKIISGQRNEIEDSAIIHWILVSLMGNSDFSDKANPNVRYEDNGKRPNGSCRFHAETVSFIMRAQNSLNDVKWGLNILSEVK